MFFLFSFTSLTYVLISIHISIYVFICLVFILYYCCMNFPKTSQERSIEKLRVNLLKLFHPIVHQCTKNVLKVLKIAHQLCHPSFIALYQAKKTILVNLSSVVLVKFIYSEKATNFCEFSTINLSYVVTVKSTVEILQNFVVFSESIHEFQQKKQEFCQDGLNLKTIEVQTF